MNPRRLHNATIFSIRSVTFGSAIKEGNVRQCLWQVNHLEAQPGSEAGREHANERERGTTDLCQRTVFGCAKFFFCNLVQVAASWCKRGIFGGWIHLQLPTGYMGARLRRTRSAESVMVGLTPLWSR